MKEIFKKIFQNKKFVVTVELIALLTAVFNSAYIAIYSPNINYFLYFFVYCFNSTTGLLSAIARGSVSIALMNVFYTVINVIGLVRAL